LSYSTDYDIYGRRDFEKDFHNDSELKNKIINLSCHGNIISKYTAFVAVDMEGAKVEGELLKKSCPIPTLSEEYMKGLRESQVSTTTRIHKLEISSHFSHLCCNY